MALLEIKAQIVKDREICGGLPRIEGTRVRVMDVVEKYEFLGYSPDQISAAFHISVSQVFSALSYYHEHPDEIREEIREHSEAIQELRKGNGN